MATSAFVAGNVTLSGWAADFTSVTTFGPPSNALFLTPASGAGQGFDFNWSANTTSFTPPNTSATDVPQVIGSSESAGDLVTLTMQVAADSAYPGAVNADLVMNGSTIGNSATLATLGGGGESLSQLLTDLKAVQVVDGTAGDTFMITFTLTDVTASASTVFNEGFAVACYAPGTRIGTPTGEIAVEDLQIGDLVTTTCGAAKPIKWIGRRGYPAAAVAGAPHLRPVLIRKDALGAGLPRRDLMVSPMHALYIDDCFIPASALVNGVSILRRESEGAAEYIHIELHDHDVVFADGLPAESFVDDDSRTMFENVAEYYDLYGLAETRRGFSAPRIEEGYRLEAIRRRIAAQAGIARSATVPGEMAANIERLCDGELEGWVMDRANPTTPVELEVLVDGEIVATVLANRYRSDLDKAGLGGGRCAFSLAMPASATDLSQIEVRRASDGRAVPMPQRARVTA